MRSGQKNTQVNIAIPAHWKSELEAIARIASVEEERTVTFQELMRRGIQEKFQLKTETDDEQ